MDGYLTLMRTHITLINEYKQIMKRIVNNRNKIKERQDHLDSCIIMVIGKLMSNIDVIEVGATRDLDKLFDDARLLLDDKVYYRTIEDLQAKINTDTHACNSLRIDINKSIKALSSSHAFTTKSADEHDKLMKMIGII
jgi:hypothetical protein